MRTKAGVSSGTNAKEVFEALLAEMKAQALATTIARYRAYTDKFGSREMDTDTTLEVVFGITPERRKAWGFIFPTDLSIIQRWFCESIRGSQFRGWLGYKLKPEPELTEAITKRATDDVDQMFARFIAKQTEKTDAIIKGRGLRVDGYVCGNLECELLFTLADGAGFKMKTQIVWKENRYGTQFWQFPTTFHDATDKNGEHISRPSEAALKAKL